MPLPLRSDTCDLFSLLTLFLSIHPSCSPSVLSPFMPVVHAGQPATSLVHLDPTLCSSFIHFTPYPRHPPPLTPPVPSLLSFLHLNWCSTNKKTPWSPGLLSNSLTRGSGVKVGGGQRWRRKEGRQIWLGGGEFGNNLSVRLEVCEVLSKPHIWGVCACVSTSLCEKNPKYRLIKSVCSS